MERKDVLNENKQLCKQTMFYFSMLATLLYMKVRTKYSMCTQKTE